MNDKTVLIEFHSSFDYFLNLIREQDLFETKILMGDSKAKVGLSFMYDCPAGLKDVSKSESVLNRRTELIFFILESRTSR